MKCYEGAETCSGVELELAEAMTHLMLINMYLRAFVQDSSLLNCNLMVKSPIVSFSILNYQSANND